MKDGKPHIVLIDDEEDIILIVEEMLSSYSVKSFINGQEGLNYVLTEKGIDLVVTDINLPGLTGHDIYNKIKEKSPTTHIIFISGFADPTNVSIAPLLVKPFSQNELLRLVKEQINKK